MAGNTAKKHTHLAYMSLMYNEITEFDTKKLEMLQGMKDFNIAYNKVELGAEEKFDDMC